MCSQAKGRWEEHEAGMRAVGLGEPCFHSLPAVLPLGQAYLLCEELLDLWHIALRVCGDVD